MGIKITFTFFEKTFSVDMTKMSVVGKIILNNNIIFHFSNYFSNWKALKTLPSFLPDAYCFSLKYHIT